MSLVSLCLLIDDDVDDQMVFASALQEVSPAMELAIEDNGIKALMRLNHDLSFTPTIIFLDLNMPLMEGKECLAELKTIARLKDVPVVIYSTSSNPKDIAEIKEQGAAVFFEKPANYLDLKNKLRVLLIRLSHSSVYPPAQ